MPTSRRSAGTGCSRLILAVTVTLAGCGSDPEPPLQVEVGVSPTPATVGEARVLVTVRTPEGSPVEDAGLTLRALAEGSDGTAAAWLPAEPAGGGVYVVDPVPLPEAGVWTLEARVERPGHAPVSRRTPLRVVGPPPSG